MKPNPRTDLQAHHTATLRACLELLEQICNQHAWNSQFSITTLINESELLSVG